MTASYKVLITTSGVGQRLGELTLYTNKSLVRVGRKPAIAYIIEQYPEDVPFVITVGYFGNLVREFIEMAYPQQNIEFVEVSPFKGKGSSLGYSMLCAKSHLQQPFIYHACDTLVEQKIPEPDTNWVGGYKGTDSTQYASYKVQKDGIRAYNEKGAMSFDYLHIGLIGIKDYQIFWNTLAELYDANPENTELNDCKVIEAMLKECNFKAIPFKVWFDIGNAGALSYARTHIRDAFDNLDKTDESIFLFKNFGIKFFSNPNLIKARCERAAILKGLVPPMERITTHFYKYTYIQGDTYSDVVTPINFQFFLEWANAQLWKPVAEVSDEEFLTVCHKFYYQKTYDR